MKPEIWMHNQEGRVLETKGRQVLKMKEVNRIFKWRQDIWQNLSYCQTWLLKSVGELDWSWFSGVVGFSGVVRLKADCRGVIKSLEGDKV